MALFGHDYDREYGYPARYRTGGMYGEGRFGYDQGLRGRPGSMYDADYGYKSRWETDFGDPYGDRTNRTPIRMIRGEFHGGYGGDYRAGYDRGFRGGWERPFRYGGGRPGYEPYENRPAHEGRPGRWNRGVWERGGRWNQESPGYRGYSENRYDSGWF